VNQQTGTRRTLYVHLRGSWPEGLPGRMVAAMVGQANSGMNFDVVIDGEADLGLHLVFEGNWDEGQKGGFARIALEQLDGIPITYDPSYEIATAQGEETS